MRFGFSYTGLIFLIMLFVPNMIWAKLKPKDYEKYVGNESRLLLVFERIGEIAVSCLLLIFDDLNVRACGAWIIWLIAAFALMVLYEIYWIRYFKSERTMLDQYRDILGIPLAGATLPVCAVLLLAVYAGNPFLLAAGVILGIGHIGIHAAHRKEALEEQKK